MPNRITRRSLALCRGLALPAAAAAALLAGAAPRPAIPQAPAPAPAPAPAAAPVPAQGARRPNVVVIVSDDQGYADVGFHGSRDVPTPHLDALAAGGVVCESGYVTFPVCSPSRAGFLAGRHGARFGYDGNPDISGSNPLAHATGLPLSERTVADEMRAAGYATGLVGKWHLGTEPHHHPNRRGFGEFFGFVGGGHQYLNWTEKPGNVYSSPIFRDDAKVPGVEKRYLTDVLTDEAVEFVTRHKDRPFFLYLAYNAPHEPLQAPQSYLDRVPASVTGRRRTYAAMVGAVDAGVGKLRARLKELGLEKNTLVVFFSDNGGPTGDNASRNAPLRGAKSQVFEGGIRVPFVVSLPGRLPAGKRYRHPVSTLDLKPTCLALAGVGAEGMASLEGVDLLPHLSGANPEPPHERLYWRHRNGAWAVREGDYKLLRTPQGVRALYNLKDDVSESRDLLAEKPEVAERLQRAWNWWNAANAARIPWQPDDPMTGPRPAAAPGRR